MIKERRKYVRLETKVDFSYRIKGSRGPEYKAVTKNISPGGIRGLVDNRIKKGTWLELVMHIPAAKKPIPAIGKVVWTADVKAGKIDVGIKFEEIDTAMKNEFLEYMCGLMFTELERSEL